MPLLERLRDNKRCGSVRMVRLALEVLTYIWQPTMSTVPGSANLIDIGAFPCIPRSRFSTSNQVLIRVLTLETMVSGTAVLDASAKVLMILSLSPAVLAGSPQRRRRCCQVLLTLGTAVRLTLIRQSGI